MHTAPSCEYKFEEYVVMGASAYARKTSDHSKADDFVKFGDKVVLGRPIANKDGRYELLTVNGIKVPSGLNVHISNLQYEAVMTKVTGSKPNMRKGNTNKSPSEGLLKDGSKVKIHPYQTEEQKKNRRYKVLEAIKADGTEAIVSSKSTIHASNIQAKIPEVHIYSKANNGIVQPHMKKMAGTNLKPASKDFKVKAGEELGKLGVYNSEWYETEWDKVVHLEVFTFDDLKSFIKKAQTEYTRPLEELSDEEKKLRPKENQFVVPKEEKELFILDDAIYGVTNKNTKIRKGMIQKDAEYKVAPSGTELELSSHKNTKRQQIKEWVGETLEANTTYSVHMKHVDYYQKFIPIPKDSEVLTKTIRKSSNKLKIEKDKDKNEYVCIDERIQLYVKKKKEYFTHGITFSNFTLINEAGADKIGIFEDVSKYYEKTTQEDATPQQDKEKLNDTFKAILQSIEVDKNKDGKLEAGEFAQLSLTKEKRKELSYMGVKHESEWEYQKEKFQPILDYLDQDPKQAKNKAMFEDRLEKLAFFPKDIVGQGKTPTFFHPLALISGFVNSGGDCMNLTLDNLKNIDKHTSLANRKKHLEGINNGMRLFEINTCLRVAHFLAQILHESAHLRATKEYGGSSASYAPYYGRGLMQLTYESNYKAYSSAIGVDVYSTDENRKKLESKPHAAQSACWFWTNFKKLNDEADRNDFLLITCRVNGGFNGFKDRLRIIKNCIKEFSLSISTEYTFSDSQIYNNWKYSLAWGLWHDSGSNKYKPEYCTSDNEKAKVGYNRFLELIKEKRISFPQKTSRGKIKWHYGHSNPKKYVEGRLKQL